MPRTRSAVLSAVTLAVAAFGLAGCSSGTPAPPAITTPSVSAPVAPPTAPLPAPEALTDVLSRLADVNVPGAQRVGLIEHGVPGDAAALDHFTQALRDNGFGTASFTARDLAWSPSEPDNVIATIVVDSGNQHSDGNFTFPMEFAPTPDGWQLTRATADQVLQFGDTAAPPPPPPPATPTPTP